MKLKEQVEKRKKELLEEEWNRLKKVEEPEMFLVKELEAEDYE